MRHLGRFSQVPCNLGPGVRRRFCLSVVIAVAAGLVMAASALATTRSMNQTYGTTSGLDQLVLNPAANLQPQLPEGSRVTIMASPLLLEKLPRTGGPQVVTFRVTNEKGKLVQGPAVAKLTSTFPGGSKWATFSYTDTAGVGVDTVTASMNAGGEKLTNSTRIAWTLPASCPAGLPSLFRPLKCSAAARMVATVYNTGGCAAAFYSAGKLADAIRAATTFRAALSAAGGSSSIAHLAVDLRALRTTGVTVSGLNKAAEDGQSVWELIKNLGALVSVAAAHGVSSEKISTVASALADLAGFGPCVDLIKDTSRPAIPQETPPSSPTLVPVSLGTLCAGDDSVYTRNGCPYNGATTIGDSTFNYSILINSNGDSVTPSYWDLIDFPATTCSSIKLTFGMPDNGSKPGDTASIEVVTETQAAQVASVSYGNTATLTATLDGGPWSLENSASNADDEIAINGTAACTSASG